MGVITTSLLKAMRSPANFQTVPIIVELAPDSNVAGVAAQVNSMTGIDIRQVLPMSNAFSIIAPTSMVAGIAGLDVVDKVHLDRTMHAFEGPALPPPPPNPFALLDTANQKLAALLADPRVFISPDTGWIPTGEANKATGIYDLHNRGFKGQGVKVWVLDTGVDPTNPQLQGVIAGMYSTTVGDPLDKQGHGTWCASRIVGQPYTHPVNGFDLLGAAPECELYSVKVLTDLGFGNTSDIMKGIEMALENGADIISLSLGGDGSATDEEDDPSVKLINKAAETHPKTIFCIAAGNSGSQGETAGSTIGIPAVAEAAVTVGCWSIIDNKRSYFSSTGPTLQAKRVKPDIMAPGGGRAMESGYKRGMGDIYSATAFGSQLDPLDYIIDGFCPLKGTSMSTPDTAGNLACWKSNVGELRAVDVKAIFQKFGKPKTNENGFGLLDSGWFLSALGT
jgi:subtilisin family serine protease